MTLNFPNASRSFDEAVERVRFWGHDGALEIQFEIELPALLALRPDTPNIEARVLAAFDEVRDRIIEAAGKIYSSRRRRYFYVLTAADF